MEAVSPSSMMIAPSGCRAASVRQAFSGVSLPDGTSGTLSPATMAPRASPAGAPSSSASASSVSAASCESVSMRSLGTSRATGLLRWPS